MVNKKVARMISEFASHDECRRNLLCVHVTETKEDKLQIEATDGHRLVRVIVDKSTVSDLLPGFYSRADWTDLVCKERPATPIDNSDGALTWPNTDSVIPRKKDQEKIMKEVIGESSIQVTVGIQVFALDPTLIAPLGKIGVSAWRWQVSSAQDPIRLDCTGPDGEEITAVVMVMSL